MYLPEIINAQIYSIKKGAEMAYELTLVDGNIIGNFKTRAVESNGKYIRTESLVNGDWLAGKTYVVEYNKKRNAEKIKSAVINFLTK